MGVATSRLLQCLQPTPACDVNVSDVQILVGSDGASPQKQPFSDVEVEANVASRPRAGSVPCVVTEIIREKPPPSALPKRPRQREPTCDPEVALVEPGRSTMLSAVVAASEVADEERADADDPWLASLGGSRPIGLSAAEAAELRDFKQAREAERDVTEEHGGSEERSGSAGDAELWAGVRPLGAEVGELPAEVARHQLDQLCAARALADEVDALLADASHDEQRVSCSVAPDRRSPATIDFDLIFTDSWHCVIRMRVRHFDCGLLPTLALCCEPDLIQMEVPPGLPKIESVRVPHRFARNDFVHHALVTPFGPFPGADDVHGLALYDMTGAHATAGVEAHAQVAIVAASPSEPGDGRARPLHGSWRGWTVPEVSGFRRNRNVLLGAATFLAAAEPNELAPPTASPGPCGTAGCGLACHPCVGAFDGLHCCGLCRVSKGRRHGPLCERRSFDAAAPRAWQRTELGALDIDMYVRGVLPIPRWLIPHALVRWVVPRLASAVYPLFLLLSGLFAPSPFGERVRADRYGLYAAVARRVPLPGLETVRRGAASVPKVGGVRVSGWRGHNARMNGEFEPIPCASPDAPDGAATLALNDRPLFQLVVHSGPRSDARMYWAQGAWRIGHVAWTRPCGVDSTTAVAYVESDAMHPSQIDSASVWREHTGRTAGADFGRFPGCDEASFRDATGEVSCVAVAADASGNEL